MSPLLHLHQLGYRHQGREILRAVSFDVLPHQILTIVGPNGAGKSTLLKLMLGLIKPSHGSIERAQGLNISYVPQKFAILPDLPMTVKRFVKDLPLADHQLWLERLQLAHLLNSPLQKLSGGELQRLLLLRAMLKKPDLIVLDEPAAGIDPAALNAFYHTISDFQQQHQLSLVMVSHDLHLVMAKSDHVLCLNQTICCEGTPESISQHPEFLRLLGQSRGKDADQIAVYTHHHRG